MEARLLRVLGRVQRTGFRRHALDLAQELGLTGYVKNLPDGSVQIFVQGEEGALSKFIEALKSPPLGEVKEIKVEKVPTDPSLKEFRIIYGEFGEELQEGFGAMQAIFMEFREEFRDFRNEFREFREESLKLNRETLSEIKELRRDLKAILDERLAKMERDIAQIKAKLGLT